MSENSPGAAAPEPFFSPVTQAQALAKTRRRSIGPEWMRVPVEFVPSSSGLVELIGITDDGLAVILSSVEVYPTGIRFQLLATPEPGNERAADAAAHQSLYGEFAGYGGRLRGRFRIGTAYQDGRTATNLFLHGEHHEIVKPPALLRVDGGSGRAGGASSAQWAWPIPDRGDLTVVFDWNSRGIAERRVVLAGDGLRAAAATSAANPIWPGAVLPAPTPVYDW